MADAGWAREWVTTGQDKGWQVGGRWSGYVGPPGDDQSYLES